MCLFTAWGGGRDTITDFELGANKIDLATFGLADFADLSSSFQVADITGGVAIDFGGGDVLHLRGIGVADLNSGDFLF